MSKQQSTRRCWRCGPVPLSHKCESEQRPQSKMRGETKGLTTGPQWTSAQWQAHLSSKQRVIGVDFGVGPDKAVEVTMEGGKVVECRELDRALEHGGKVLAGDVWDMAGYKVRIDCDDAGQFAISGWPYGSIGQRDWFINHGKLLSRAQKAERAKGEFRVGDRVRVSRGLCKGEAGVVTHPSGNAGTGEYYVDDEWLVTDIGGPVDRARWGRGYAFDVATVGEWLELIEAVEG